MKNIFYIVGIGDWGLGSGGGGGGGGGGGVGPHPPTTNPQIPNPQYEFKIMFKKIN